MTRRARGFSLIEMAFVLVIVTLLLGGLLVPFATQVEQKRIAETNKTLEEIKEALIGYALSHSSTVVPIQPILPCPDFDNDGLEDRVGNLCDVDEGNLSWATLGAGNQDAWGNRFHYRASRDFTRAAGFGLTDVGNIDVCNAAPTVAVGCNPNQSVANNVPAVVVSYGKNGYGGRNSNTAAANAAPTGADEIENQSVINQPGSKGAIFVSHTLVLPGAATAEFDDQVMWLSPNVLFNRMVAAGRLP